MAGHLRDFRNRVRLLDEYKSGDRVEPFEPSVRQRQPGLPEPAIRHRPSTGTGTSYVAQNAFYDRNDRVVASAPAYAADTKAAYDGAVRDAFMARASQFFGSMRSAHGTPAPPAATQQPAQANPTSKKRDPALGINVAMRVTLAGQAIIVASPPSVPAPSGGFATRTRSYLELGYSLERGHS